MTENASFSSSGRKEQMKLHSRSGKHGDGPVYQINGSSALFSFLVDNASFFYVMSNIGDVHTHFPQSVFYGADRKCVVKIFGIFRVDGESCYLTEIFASGNLFGVISAGILSAAVSTAFGYT